MFRVKWYIQILVMTWLLTHNYKLQFSYQYGYNLPTVLGGVPTTRLEYLLGKPDIENGQAFAEIEISWKYNELNNKQMKHLNMLELMYLLRWFQFQNGNFERGLELTDIMRESEIAIQAEPSLGYGFLILCYRNYQGNPLFASQKIKSKTLLLFHPLLTYEAYLRNYYAYKNCRLLFRRSRKRPKSRWIVFVGQTAFWCFNVKKKTKK